jgi:hypothetical protein
MGLAITLTTRPLSYSQFEIQTIITITNNADHVQDIFWKYLPQFQPFNVKIMSF